jgi:carboxyl-terminal processing protease
MNLRRLFGPVITGTLAVLIGCTPTKPLQPAQPTDADEYEFCWEALSALFIYQERLPSNPNLYSNPVELYASVNDRYTNYYDPVWAEYIYKMLSSTTGGVGIRIDTASGQYYIKDVFQNSPGEKAGLKTGDTLIMVGSTSLTGISRDSLTSLLEGNIGDHRAIQVKRTTGLVTITVTIGEYLAPSVFTETIDSSTAYILLTMFSDSTLNPNGSAAEFSDALDKTAWAKYTVLDLRHNLGGAVTQCIGISSQFIPKDSMIIMTKSREYDSVVRKDFFTESGGLKAIAGQKALTRKFAVLVDDSTASASEILVSCLKDYRSATVKIIGQKTFGKGSGWALVPTPKNGIATITCMLQFPIHGPDYNHIGIIPDSTIPSGADAEKVALGFINGGALGKVLANSNAADRIHDLRAAFMPKNRIPMCVIKPNRCSRN